MVVTECRAERPAAPPPAHHPPYLPRLTGGKASERCKGVNMNQPIQVQPGGPWEGLVGTGGGMVEWTGVREYGQE